MSNFMKLELRVTTQMFRHLMKIFHMYKTHEKFGEKILRNKTEASSRFEKKLFSNLDEASVLTLKIFSTHFSHMLYMRNVFIRLIANF